jgi:pyruvate kinase
VKSVSCPIAGYSPPVLLLIIPVCTASAANAGRTYGIIISIIKISIRNRMKTYSIIATLGPASDRPDIWAAMLTAGATGFRLNTSHLSLEQLAQWLERLEHFLHGRYVPVVLDLQGSKWRLGQFDGRELMSNERVTLVLGKTSAEAGEIPVPHADFFTAAARSDGEVVLNDAKVRLQVEEIEAERVKARVVLAGPLAANKGITLSRSVYRTERLNDKDAEIYRQTAELDWVHYAVSYVKDGAEMRHYRDLLGGRADLIAKLEREPALADVQRIAAQAGEVWVCRGDLGAELGLRAMAEAVHGFTSGLPALNVPALMAGQVIEHMVSSPVPTRSEVCYLHDALTAGYAGVVLSDETALGKYPVEACSMAAQFK